MRVRQLQKADWRGAEGSNLGAAPGFLREKKRFVAFLRKQKFYLPLFCGFVTAVYKYDN